MKKLEAIYKEKVLKESLSQQQKDELWKKVPQDYKSVISGKKHVQVRTNKGATLKPLDNVTKDEYKQYIKESLSTEALKWQDAERGDNARVKSLNKMGVILKAYGRKFHLRFPDGSEKTFDANELEFHESVCKEYTNKDIDKDINKLVKTMKKMGYSKKQMIDYLNKTYPGMSDWKDKQAKDYVESLSALDKLHENVLKERWYYDFLNKDKGFKVDRKYFKSFDDAKQWVKKNIDNANRDHFDQIEQESIKKEAFTKTDMDQLLQKIKSTIREPYVQGNVSTLGGQAQASVMLTVSKDEKSDWPNGILQNSRYAHFSFGHDGVIEHFSGSLKPYMCKSRFKTIDEAVTKLKRYLDSHN